VWIASNNLPLNIVKAYSMRKLVKHSCGSTHDYLSGAMMIRLNSLLGAFDINA